MIHPEIAIYSLVMNIILVTIIGLIGFNYKSQIKRIDKHDEVLDEIRNDISVIKSDVSYLRGKYSLEKN